ncbi:hypothetical protein RFI_04911 [Reticulomyxa filosa]|uniref:Uncharacterized protein n=1 Tax=Reticulomyxa filosa TaxID=46433 RepID=X6P3Q6_RETFI|nr:hypothetical protein RFI_04911 [Reticulomyxa filosa]|eukprot:ETO32207.1 hypothetical protein RFI_04911 [Reticulomyxa filosa]
MGTTVNYKRSFFVNFKSIKIIKNWIVLMKLQYPFATKHKFFVYTIIIKLRHSIFYNFSKNLTVEFFFRGHKVLSDFAPCVIFFKWKIYLIMGNNQQKSTTEKPKTENADAGQAKTEKSQKLQKIFPVSSVSKSSKALSKASVLSFTDKMLGYEIDRQDVDSVMTSLREWDTSPIQAVWLCSRPISRIANGRFHHWCVKVHCGDTLLEFDFFEKNARGVFGFKPVKRDIAAEQKQINKRTIYICTYMYIYKK